MLWLSIAAILSAAPQAGAHPAPVSAAAVATVRIERASEIRAETWSRAPANRRRDLDRTDDSGRKIVVRVIEHE